METRKCDRCNGKGKHLALVSQHDDVKEIVKCIKCRGKGKIHYMSEDEERELKENL